MRFIQFIGKHKNRIANIACIILALMIASKIYNRQVTAIELLKEKNDAQIKKNKVLDGISKLETRINSYKNLLIEKDASLIMNTIANVAKDSNIKIVSIKPMREEKYLQYSKFPFNLMLSAPNYHALGRFINKIESSQDVYIVESVVIRAETKELAVDFKVSSIAFTD